MKIQVIVATMHQTDHSLLEKMNIQTDAVICNQCDKFDYEEFTYNGHNIKWLSFNEHGVGLNRNNGLMRAEGDILLFADDDVVYNDGYPEVIENYYKNNPKADMVVFNMSKRRDQTKPFYDAVNKNTKLKKRNATKYGTVSISIKNEKLKFANINFHRDFGGGATYSCGEDTLFLQDCVKAGLRCYTSTEKIGVIDQKTSTWFCGYNDKFFFDKGVLFYKISSGMCRFYALYHCLKHRKKYSEYGWKNAYKQMLSGIRSVKK